jgi:hypothetical protein
MEHPDERTAARQDREQREAATPLSGVPEQGAVQTPPKPLDVPLPNLDAARAAGKAFAEGFQTGMVDDPSPAAVGEPKPLVCAQTARVGDRVMLNAHQFDWDGLSPADYGWRVVSPDGWPVDLTNPHMPGPSFIPLVPGAYKATIGTPHGDATVTITVTED